jgi:hypothetical protein
MKRRSLNRGTAVYLGQSQVKLIWPCGCTKIEFMHSPSGALPPAAVAKLVSVWRKNGVTLEQCKKHPDYYNRESQVDRLNKENPPL